MRLVTRRDPLLGIHLGTDLVLTKREQATLARARAIALELREMLDSPDGDDPYMPAARIEMGVNDVLAAVG